MCCVMSSECGGVSHLKYQETSPLFVLSLPSSGGHRSCLPASVPRSQFAAKPRQPQQHFQHYYHGHQPQPPLKVQQRTLCGEKSGKISWSWPWRGAILEELFNDSVPGKFTACGQFLHISIWMPKPSYCSDCIGPDDACSSVAGKSWLEFNLYIDTFSYYSTAHNLIGMLVQKLQIVISYEPLVWTSNPVSGFTWFGKILSTFLPRGCNRSSFLRVSMPRSRNSIDLTVTSLVMDLLEEFTEWG